VVGASSRLFVMARSWQELDTLFGVKGARTRPLFEHAREVWTRVLDGFQYRAPTGHRLRAARAPAYSSQPAPMTTTHSALAGSNGAVARG